jgi:hypothetical protein
VVVNSCPDRKGLSGSAQKRLGHGHPSDWQSAPKPASGYPGVLGYLRDDSDLLTGKAPIKDK